MKKKIILAAILAALCLSGCAKTESSSNSATSDTSASTQGTSEPSLTTADTEETSEPATTASADEINPASEATPESALSLDEFKALFSDNAVLAVAFIGSSEQETADCVTDCAKNSAVAEKYSFIGNISSDKIVFAGGTEVYCVIPSDSVSELSVSSVLFDDEGVSSKSDAIYGGNGEPILLVCNSSDIMANSIITATSGDSVKEYSPSISLRDGSLFIQENETEIYDFSEYSFEVE